MASPDGPPFPFRCFKASPGRVPPHARFPLLLRSVEDLLHERGVRISHEVVRFWWSNSRFLKRSLGWEAG